MKLLKSILQDLKSWEKIKYNRWHLHAPIAFVIGFVLSLIMDKSISDTYILTEYFFKVFAPSLIGFIGLALFEGYQQRNRFVDTSERFESNKDLWVGEFFLILGVILNIVL
jgi:hypothetical protein